MNLRSLITRAKTWPEIDQEELAKCAAEIESRRSSIFSRNEDEWAAFQQGIERTDADKFAAGNDE